MDRKDQLKKEAKGITDLCKQEIRMMNDEESQRLEAIKAELRDLNTQYEQLQEELRNQSNQESNKENKFTQKSMEKRDFSLLSAIRSIANNRPQDELTNAVIEAGSAELRKAGINGVGQIQLPSKEFRTVTVATEGVDTVATDLMDVLEPLRAKSVLGGAKWLTGLTGDVQYPVMSSINATWEGETAKTADSTPTFTNVKLQPKRLSVVVPISKQFIIQDSCGAEQAIRNEIINAVRDKLEATILGNADATSTQPAGLFYNAGQPLTQITDFQGICTLEAGIENSNISGEMTYIMSPNAKGDLRGMAKTGTANGLVFEGGEVDGTPVLTTSNVSGKQMLYGNLDNLAIGQWGNLDITVDTVTLAAEGCIRLVVNSYWDAKVLRSGAFAVATL